VVKSPDLCSDRLAYLARVQPTLDYTVHLKSRTLPTHDIAYRCTKRKAYTKIKLLIKLLISFTVVHRRGAVANKETPLAGDWLSSAVLLGDWLAGRIITVVVPNRSCER
jgi:hypothetical protein